MPIIINQLGHPDPTELQNPGGLREYEVRINRERIAKFTHRRKNGLAACLRAAARAVDEAPPSRKVRM